MAELCLADIDRWSIGDIGAVFGICIDVSNHCANTSASLTSLDAFSTWTGQAAEAAKDSVHKIRKDLDRHGEVARKVAEAARKAQEEVLAVRNKATALRSEAAANGLSIDPHTDTVSATDPPDMKGWPEADRASYRHEIEDLQFRVNALILAAATADHDLANAIKLADGEKEDVSWKPSAKELTLGGVGAGTAAESDLLRGIWQAAMGEHPKGLDAKILPWLKELGESKGLKGASGAAGIVGVLTAVPSIIADHGDGDSWGEAITREGTGVVVGTGAAVATSSAVAGLAAGAETGAEAGAAVGSIIPGAGTVAGAALGALAGAGAAWAASKGMSWLLK